MKDAGGHNGVLHQQILLLKVTTERAPRVSETARITVEKLSAGIEWWSCALASPRSRMFRPRCAPCRGDRMRSDRCFLLRRARGTGCLAATGGAALAGTDLRLHGAQRGQCAGLLPYPLQRVVELGTKVEI